MKIVWAIIVIIVGYFLWRFVIMGDAIVFLSPTPAKRVTGVVKRITPGKEIVIEIDSCARQEFMIPKSAKIG